jgi:hypothetical protein
MMNRSNAYLKEFALNSTNGVGYEDNGRRELRSGLSMGVVKVDEAVPDWDTYEVQYGKSNPETWVGIRWNFICSDEVNQHDESR